MAGATGTGVITIFRSRLRNGVAEEYEREAVRMVALAREVPGFVEYASYVSSDGERVTIVEFDSEEAHAAWRAHPEHRLAQRRGREEFYDYFRIDVCRRVRSTAGGNTAGGHLTGGTGTGTGTGEGSGTGA